MALSQERIAELDKVPARELVEYLALFKPEALSSIRGELVVRHITQSDGLRDSIEIGTAGKGGTIKVYFDSSAPLEDINAKLDRMFQAREHAQLKAKEGNGGGQ